MERSSWSVVHGPFSVPPRLSRINQRLLEPIKSSFGRSQRIRSVSPGEEQFRDHLQGPLRHLSGFGFFSVCSTILCMTASMWSQASGGQCRSNSGLADSQQT